MGMTINGKLDTRFSQATEPVGWQQVSDAMRADLRGDEHRLQQIRDEITPKPDRDNGR